jgi:hypothetical protein
MQERLIGHVHVSPWGYMGLMRIMAMRHIQQEHMESNPLPKQNSNAKIRHSYMTETAEHAIYTPTAREVSSDVP